MALARFELTIDELRARQGTKWERYPNALPLWVADMDFRVSPAVDAAIRRLVDRSDYGYAYRHGEWSLPGAYAARMQRLYQWRVDPDLVLPVTELIQCMYGTLIAFAGPGEGAIMQTPIYPPFLNAVADTGRRMVENPLKDSGQRLELDVPGLEAVIDKGTRLFLFCNPHNPTGRVFERADLEAIGRIAIERDLIIVVDEIHQDLIHPGHRHIPMASLSPEIAARTITLTSATKGFNIAGLRCAVMVFGSGDLKARYLKAIPDRLMGQVSNVGMDATVAAWRESDDWLAAVLQRLTANRDHVEAFVRAEMPAIRHHKPEGTYLYWLNCNDLPINGSAYDFFLNEAGVAFSGGEAFGERGNGCVRLNFATSTEVLDKALGQMAKAVARLR